MMRRAWWLCVLLWSCSQAGGVDSLVGFTCKTSDECDPSGECITSGQDGACTLGCIATDAVGECPRGTYCDRLTVTTDVRDESERTLCMPACKSQDDCREGYACNGVNGGPGKVCRPK